MRIAIPVVDNKLCAHFGHCAAFALLDVDADTKQITGAGEAPAPPHQPGLLPAWLAERSVNVVLAGGMGQRAQAIFREHGIDVRVGCPAASPEELTRAYVDGTLASGENFCDH